MVKRYKVIKEFDVVRKDQIFEYNEDCNLYEYSVTSEGDRTFYNTYMSLSPSICEELEEEGFLEAMDKEELVDSTNSKSAIKLTAISALIADLKNKYEARNAKVQKKYDAGKMQTCVKVEHDTVHFNLMKLLNQFEKIVNE